MENNNSFKTLLWVLIGLAIVIVAVVLISRQGNKNKPENMVVGEARVDAIVVNKDKAFPVGVMIAATGHFTDNCTTLGDIKQGVSGNKFMVKMESKRPLDPKDCSAGNTPFEKSFILEGVTGLAKGDYVVDVNGVTGAFSLTMDNFVSENDPLK